MAGNLQFDVSANDRASGTFTAVAAQIKELGRELDKLDGRNVRAKVTINTPSSGQIGQLDRARTALAEIDGKHAKAKVEITGIPEAADVARLRRAAKALKELDGANATGAVAIAGLDGLDPKPLRAVARALKQLQDIGVVYIRVVVTGAAEEIAAIIALGRAIRQLPDEHRTRVKADVDKSALDRIKSLGSALKSVASAAGGLTALAKPMAILSAAGSAVQVVGGLVGALQQLAPAALLLPGALLAGGAALATFKIATSGVGDALKGDADALAKLAPEAKKFVSAITGMKPKLDDLKKTVQGKFFGGFSDDVKRLGSTYLPILKTGLSGIAESLNGIVRAGAQSLISDKAGEDTANILDNTTSLLGNMKNALANAVTGFIGLGSIGSNYLPALGTAIDNVTAKFKNWVAAGTADGSIKASIDRALVGFRDLGAVLVNVGRIAGSVFTGLGGAVSSPLAALRDLTGALADFFASAQAQGPLRALGDTMRVVGGVVKDILLAGLKAIGPIVEALAPIAQELARTIGTVLVSAFRQLGPPLERLITRLQPVLVPALEAIGKILTDAVIPALASFIDWLGNGGFDTASVMFQQFALNATQALRMVLDLLSGFTGALAATFRGLSWLPGVGGKFGKMADALDGAKTKLDGFRGSLDKVESTQVLLLQKTLEDIARKKYSGTVTLDGDPRPLGDKIQQAITLANGSKGTMLLDGDGTPLQARIGQNKYLIDKTTGVMKIDGDPAPGEADLSGFKVKVDKTTGLMTLEANPNPADARVTAWKALADGIVGVPELNANPEFANAALQLWKSTSDATTGFPTIDATSGKAEGVLKAWEDLANGTTGIPALDANPDLAHAILAEWKSRSDTTTGIPKLNADPAPATAVLDAWQALANGTFGIPQLDANPGLANAVLQLWKSTSDATTGLPNIDAKSGKAEGVLAAWKALANGTTGIPELDSNPALANQILAAWKARSDSTTGLPKLTAVPNVSAAEAALDNAARDRYATVFLTTRGVASGVVSPANRAQGAYAVPRAAGAYVAPAAYAMGGLRPMLANRAEIVPPAQPRIIGDRMQGDEAFIPILPGSKRSQLILEQAVKGMGRQLVPQGGQIGAVGRAGGDLSGRISSALGPARGGTTITNTFHATFTSAVPTGSVEVRKAMVWLKDELRKIDRDGK